MHLEQLVFGEAPGASNTGFRLLGHSDGLNPSEISELESRANVGHALDSERRASRHFAHDILSSGRHAFSVRERSESNTRESKLLGQWLVLAEGDARAVGDIDWLFDPARRDAAGHLLASFRETESYRGSISARTLPGLELAAPSTTGREDLRARWGALEHRAGTAAAAALTGVLLDSIGDAPVVVADDDRELSSAIVRFAAALLPVADRLRSTWSTLASPRQWYAYSFCAIAPDERRFVEHTLVIDRSVRAPRAATRAGRIVEWLTGGDMERLERFLQAMDASRASMLAVQHTADLWAIYDTVASAPPPSTPDEVRAYLKPLSRPYQSEPAWLVIDPIAAGLAAAVARIKPERARAEFLKVVVAGVQQVRRTALKATLAALARELRAAGCGDAFLALVPPFLDTGAAMAEACTAALDLTADVRTLSENPRLWNSLAAWIVNEQGRRAIAAEVRDTWTQVLIYSGGAPAVQRLLEQLPPAAALRVSRIGYYGLSSDHTAAMVSTMVRRAAAASQFDGLEFDSVFAWACTIDRPAAQAALLAHLMSTPVSDQLPRRFIDRLTDGCDLPGSAVTEWRTFVQTWAAIADEQVAECANAASDRQWDCWWAPALGEVLPDTPHTFRVVYARAPGLRAGMMARLVERCEAADGRGPLSSLLVRSAIVDLAPIEEQLRTASGAVQWRAGLALLQSGVLRPAAARRWQDAIRTALVDRSAAIGDVDWMRLDGLYPTFVEDVARRLIVSRNARDIERLLSGAPPSVLRGVRGMLLSMTISPRAARSLRTFWRPITSHTTFEQQVLAGVEHLLAAREAGW